MSNIKKFQADKKQGLFIKSMRSGAKGLTRNIVESAILRAMRRGRITKTVAKNCMSNWPKQMSNQNKEHKWGIIALNQLKEVANHRRRGQFDLAHIVLKDVKTSINQSKMH